MNKSLFKLLAFALVASITSFSLHAMEEQLTAENIANHPKFKILADRMEEIGGTLIVRSGYGPVRGCLQMERIFYPAARNLKPSSTLRSIDFKDKDFWNTAEQIFQQFLNEKNSAWELEQSLPVTLRGLCIVEIGSRYLLGDELAIEQTEKLPEDLKILVLKIARKIQ